MHTVSKLTIATIDSTRSTILMLGAIDRVLGFWILLVVTVRSTTYEKLPGTLQ